MPGEVSLPPGFILEPVTTGLTYPTSVTFDDDGNIYVGEAGFSYGPAKADGMGRILKVNPDGSRTEVARGFRGPMTSITWHKGFFYVALINLQVFQVLRGSWFRVGYWSCL